MDRTSSREDLHFFFESGSYAAGSISPVGSNTHPIGIMSHFGSGGHFGSGSHFESGDTVGIMQAPRIRSSGDNGVAGRSRTSGPIQHRDSPSTASPPSYFTRPSLQGSSSASDVSALTSTFGPKPKFIVHKLKHKTKEETATKCRLEARRHANKRREREKWDALLQVGNKTPAGRKQQPIEAKGRVAESLRERATDAPIC
jgi:hypothetical protein